MDHTKQSNQNSGNDKIEEFKVKFGELFGLVLYTLSVAAPDIKKNYQGPIVEKMTYLSMLAIDDGNFDGLKEGKKCLKLHIEGLLAKGLNDGNVPDVSQPEKVNLPENSDQVTDIIDRSQPVCAKCDKHKDHLDLDR